jgi:hypothetical protein
MVKLVYDVPDGRSFKRDSVTVGAVVYDAVLGLYNTYMDGSVLPVCIYLDDYPIWWRKHNLGGIREELHQIIYCRN